MINETTPVSRVLNPNIVVEFQQSLKQQNFENCLLILQNAHKVIKPYFDSNCIESIDEAINTRLFFLINLPTDSKIWMQQQNNNNLHIPLMLHYVIDLATFLRMLFFL